MNAAAGLLLVVALIGANSYFVAQEFAFVAVRRTRLAELRDRGHRRAARAMAVTERLSFMLSGAQLGITASSLLVGFVAEPTIARLLRPLVVLVGVPEGAALGIALILALVLATGVQMVLGELAPKNLAIARPEAASIVLATTTLLYLRVAGPVIRFFDGASNGFLRLLRIDPAQALKEGVDPEELQHIITVSSDDGSLSRVQTALLGRALDFRALRAGDAMVPRTHVVAIGEQASGADLRALARASGHSRFPVIGEDLDQVRGVVEAKDLLRVPAAERDRTPVSQLMAAPFAVPESTPLPRLLDDLRAARTPLALTIDEHGGTAGIVTLEDVVEELVGEIRDEYDPAEPQVLRRADGTFVVPGSWRLDEVARDAGVSLPEGDYDTVSGMVMAHLGRLPEVDDVVELPTAHLRVLALDGHAVERVQLRPAAAADDSEPS